MLPELSKQEAIRLAATDWWKTKTAAEIVAFQLYQERLCMNFGDFHEATEKALGRPVWTHEFARPESLRAEFEGKSPKRTVAQSVAMLSELVGPERVIILTKESPND